MKGSFGSHPGGPAPRASSVAHFCIVALLLLLGTGVALGLVHTAADTLDLARLDAGPGAAVHWVVALLLAAGSLAAALWLARRRDPVPVPVFLGVLAASTLLLRWLLIGTVEPTWSTDYLRYWQRAMEMAASGHVSASDIYQQRALLVPYPVEFLFGPGATTALKWTNALLLLLVQLAAYDVMRLTTSHRAAQASSLVLAASPFPAYAALIPSHDLWALVFLAGVIWTATRTWCLPRARVPRIASVLGLGAVCAVFAYCLELQRSTGLLACIALVVASIVHLAAQRLSPPESRGTPGPALLAVAVLALVLQPVVAAGARTIGIDARPDERTDVSISMKFAAHGGSMSTGRSAWYARFDDRFHEKSLADPAEARDFSTSVILSTWGLQPLGKLDAMREHAGRLFSLSYPPDWDTLLRRPAGMGKGVRSALLVHIDVFGLLLLVATLASLSVLCLRPSRLAFPALSGAVFVSGVALALLALFENKPFNLAPVWLLYPLLLGCAGVRAQAARLPATTPSNGAAIRLVVLAAAGIVVGCLAAWSCFRAVYGVNQGMVLDGWHLELKQSTQGQGTAGWEDSLAHERPRAFEPRYYVHDRRSFVLRDAPEDARRIQARSDRLYLTLRFPPGPVSTGDRLSAEREICLDGERNTLEFFMFAPYLRRNVKEAFTLEVAVDGKVVKRRPIPHADRSDSMQLVSVAGLPAGGDRCHALSITLLSNVDRTALSWANASHVEIWFPRLVP